MKKLDEIRERVEKATPGEWEARCKEFSNTARPRFIWDSSWGFIAECNSGSQDEVNAEFIAHAKQDIPRLLKALDVATETLALIESGNFMSKLLTYEATAKQGLESVEHILEGES